VTTVAANSQGMAADTQLTGDYRCRVSKLFKLPDGSIAGGAGVWARAYGGLKWLESGRQGEAPDLEGATLLILRADGTLWMADGQWPEFPLLDGVAAIGSGAQAAVEAMQSGADPQEAVARAARVDAYTASPVQSLSLEGRRAKRPRPARRG
jgi:hypothetical protein